VNLAWVEPLKRRIEPWKRQWNALGSRERRALTVLGAFLGLLLFYLVFWLPVQAGLSRSQARLASIEGQLAQVRSEAALVAGLRAAPPGEPPADVGSAFQEAAVANGLKEAVKRVDADGARSVRVQIEAAPFPALMSLLVDLQKKGLRAEKARLDRNPKPGTVNADLTLQAQGA